MIAFRNLTKLMGCNSEAMPVARRVILWSLEGLLAAAVVVVTWLG
jgi:hypothetical protein